MLRVIAEPLADHCPQPDASQLVTVAVGRDATEQVGRPIHTVPLAAHRVQPLPHGVVVLGKVRAQPVLDTTVEAEDVGILDAAGNGVETALVEWTPRLLALFPAKFVDIGNHIVAHLEGVGHILFHLVNRHQEVLLALFIVL